MSFNESFKTTLGFKPFETREAFLPEGQKALKCADSFATSYCLFHFLNMSALPSTPGAENRTHQESGIWGGGGSSPTIPLTLHFPCLRQTGHQNLQPAFRGLLSDWLTLQIRSITAAGELTDWPINPKQRCGLQLYTTFI